MQDKAFLEMVQILFPIASQVVVTHAKNPRAATTAQLAEAAGKVGTEVIQSPSVELAVRRAAERTSENGVIVITGSIFVVGEALRALQIAV
jgi:dihydrofolate synthase/folylpolyglutamate synthase